MGSGLNLCVFPELVPMFGDLTKFVKKANALLSPSLSSAEAYKLEGRNIKEETGRLETTPLSFLFPQSLLALSLERA